MRTSLDLPDELMRRAKIAAVKRGSTLRDLIAEGLLRVLKDEPVPLRKRMTEPPVSLPPGYTIPLRSNRELAQLLEQDEIEAGQEFEVQRIDRGEYRLVLAPPPNRGVVEWLLQCPQKDFFVPIESESTDSL